PPCTYSHQHPPTHLHPPPFPTRRSSDLARSTATAKPMPAATIAEKNLVSMTTSPSLSRQQSVAGCHNRFHQESAMQGRLMLTLTDRKSTRLNSSHSQISYAVFCLKKKIL